MHSSIRKKCTQRREIHIDYMPCCINFLTLILLLHFKDDECRNIEFKEPVANKAMEKHVIRSEEVLSEGSCRLMCYMEPNCVSINLGPLEGGKHKCDLNDATDENQFANSLVNKPAFTYLAIEVMSYKNTPNNLLCVICSLTSF